jgi:hypothetical protein
MKPIRNYLKGMGREDGLRKSDIGQVNLIKKYIIYMYGNVTMKPFCIINLW